MNKPIRPTWQEYWVNMVNAISQRGTCDRGQSGAVIVKDNTMISSGYVGSAAGDDHCDDVGHKFEYRIKDMSDVHVMEYDEVEALIEIEAFIPFRMEVNDSMVIRSKDSITKHCVRTIHAEQNAICQAAKHGHAIDGATMYCSMVPCRACAMMIINSGIKKVIALKEYQTSDHTKNLFQKCNIELVILDQTINTY